MFGFSNMQFNPPVRGLSRDLVKKYPELFEGIGLEFFQ
jgi:hypothetical protein